MIADRPDWLARAACRGRTEAFYPPFEAPTRRGDPDPYLDARKMWSVSPVIEPCRVAGAVERFGMWGGLSPAERSSHRRHSAAPPPGSERRLRRAHRP